jgi:aminopeptidase N
MLHHRANLVVELTPPSLRGHGEVHLRVLSAGRAVQLDTVGMRILSAGTDEQGLRFAQHGDSTCFELSMPKAKGDELTLALKWEVDPSAHGLCFADDQVWAGYRTPAWLPTRLDPSQRATLSLNLTFPEGLEVAVSHQMGGSYPKAHGFGVVRSTQVLTTPASPAQYAFAIGRFRRANYYGQGFLLSAVGPEDADLDRVLELTLPLYQFLRERFGALPGYRYTQVFVRGNVAQEAVSMSLMSDEVLRRLGATLAPEADWTIAHELVHQWFGVLVPTASLNDLWLSEGIATFMVAAMKEHRWGQDAYHRELEIWRSRSREIHALRHDAPLVLLGQSHEPAESEAQIKANGVIYARGALVLDRLRRELGERVFWEALRSYVAKQAGRPTRTADLQQAFADVSGRDLEAFFKRWVYGVAYEF